MENEKHEKPVYSHVDNAHGGVGEGSVEPAVEASVAIDEHTNPLVGIPHDELMRDVEIFAAESGLEEHVELLRKGALLAQDGEYASQLGEEEQLALRQEVTHKWKHPKTLYLTIVLNSIAAAVQGWDVTGSNGANLSFPEAFGIDDTGDACTAAGTCEANSWLIGLINAVPFITISIV
jgi:hypothetical protein